MKILIVLGWKDTNRLSKAEINANGDPLELLALFEDAIQQIKNGKKSVHKVLWK